MNPVNGGSDKRDIHLPAVGMTGDHQVSARGKRRVGRVRIVRQHQPAVRVRDRMQQLVQIPVVFPKVAGADKPQTTAGPLKRHHFLPQVLAGPGQPVLGPPGVRPVVVIAQHGKHPRRRMQLGQQRPYRIDLPGGPLFMDIIASADRHVTRDAVRPGNDVAQKAQRHQRAIMQVGEVDKAKPGKGRRQMRHRNPVRVRPHQITLAKHGIPRRQAEQPGIPGQLEKMSPGKLGHFCAGSPIRRKISSHGVPRYFSASLAESLRAALGKVFATQSLGLVAK